MDASNAIVQSLVRKSLYAAQGVPTGKIQLPLYVNGMYPANGDEHWAFGNVRFDWSESIPRGPIRWHHANTDTPLD